MTQRRSHLREGAQLVASSFPSFRYRGLHHGEVVGNHGFWGATYRRSNSLCPLFNTSFGSGLAFLPHFAGFGRDLGVSAAASAAATLGPAQPEQGRTGQESPLRLSGLPVI